ncbi:MAG: aromatic amino acid DMT transporter YddG [Thermodesulfobacteriota bacterium]
MKTVNDSHLATAGGVGAILLWSSTVALVRSLSEQLGPLTAATAVYSFSGVAALVSLLRSRERQQKVLHLPAGYLVACGLLFVGYMLLLFLAIGAAGSRQQVLEVGLLNYLWPVLTLLLSVVLQKKKAGWGLLPGTLLALAGIFVVVTHEAQVSWHSFYRNFAGNPAAYVPALCAAVFWAVYSNLANKFAGGRDEGAVAVFLPVTAVVSLLVCLFIDEAGEWSRRSLVEALFLGLATYVAYAWWDNAMRRGNIVIVAAASYITPFLSTVASALYLSVMPGARLWAGCGILVLGSILSWQSVSGASASTAAQPADSAR